MSQRPERLMATKRYPVVNMSDCKTDLGSQQSILKGSHIATLLNLQNLNNVKRDSQPEYWGYQTKASERKPNLKADLQLVTSEEMSKHGTDSRSMMTSSQPPASIGTPHFEKRWKKQLPRGFVTREEMEVRVFLKRMKARNMQELNKPDENPSPVIISTNESKPKTYPRPIKKKPINHSEGVTTEIQKSSEGVSQSRAQKQTLSKISDNNTTKCIPRVQNSEEKTKLVDSQLPNSGPTSVVTNAQQQTSDNLRIASSSSIASVDILSDRITSTAIRRQSKNIRGPTGLKVLIMNANGDDDKRGSVPERRRHTIQSIVNKYEPDLVLFQEFTWRGIRRKSTWSEHPLPEQYEYTGHSDASIMFDSRLLAKVDPLPASGLDAIVRYLQSNQNNRLQTPFPTDFNPISRMCARVISTAAKPCFELICISWHGPSNKTGGKKGGMKKLDKIEYFEYLMEFFRNIREKFKLPILVAGDFNIAMNEIEKIIRSPFKLCKYEASRRRTERGIIDFCIFTEDLEMGHTNWINLKTDSEADNSNEIFNHDPIITSVKASTFSTTGAAMGFGKKTSWPSPIVKAK